MKQTPSNALNEMKKFRFLFSFLSLVLISGIYSCNNKKNATQLSSTDSLNITKAIVKDKSKFEQVYYLKLSAENQKKLFNNGNNNVKQLYFTWHSYPGNMWGLDASGYDETGKTKITGPIELERITTITPLNNYWCDRVEPQISTRGQIKNILSAASVGQNVVIKDNEYKDLYFSPTSYNYSDVCNSMFFIITSENKISLGSPKITLAGQQGYTNPAPPFDFACTGGCDAN